MKKHLDLSEFKKVDADARHTTFQHPDGHIIKVAHKKLDQVTHQEMRRLPFQKMKDGGMAEAPKSKVSAFANDNRPDGNYPMTPEQIAEQDAGRGGYPNPLATEHAGVASQEAPVQAGSMDEREPQGFFSKFIAAVGGGHTPDGGNVGAPIPGFERAPQAPQGQQPEAAPDTSLPDLGNTQGQGGDMSGLPQSNPAGYQDLIAGVNAESKARQQLAQGQLGVEQEKEKGLRQIADSSDRIRNTLLTQQSSLQKALANQEIKPQTIFTGKDGLGKITTALGLLMGGVGSGLNGQPNQVMKFLDDQINREVDAQKANLGRTKSLLEFNQQQLQNHEAATAATKANYYALMASKTEQMALKAVTPIAKAQAQQAVAEFQMKSQAYNNQAAKQAALSHAVQSGAMSPENAINFLPEKDQHEADKALGQVRGLDAFREALHNTNKKLSEMRLAGKFSPNKRNSLIDNLAGHLSKLTAGRFNLEEAKKQVSAVLYAPTDDILGGHDTKDTKTGNIDTLIDSMRAEHLPILNRFGIAPPRPVRGNSKHNPSKR